MRSIVKNLRIIGLAVVASLALAGCNSSMTALAPATGSAPLGPLAVSGIEGPSAEISAKYTAILAAEAKARGLTLAEGAAATRLKTFLSAYPVEGGRNAIAWVLDVSENGQSRAYRASGAIPVASAADAWAAFDENAMRLVARASLDALQRRAGPTQAAAAAASGEES